MFTQHKIVKFKSEDIILSDNTKIMEGYDYYTPGVLIVDKLYLLGFLIGETLGNKSVIRVIKNNRAYDLIVDSNKCSEYNAAIDYCDYGLRINEYIFTDDVIGKIAKLVGSTLTNLGINDAKSVYKECSEKYAYKNLRNQQTHRFNGEIYYEIPETQYYFHQHLFTYCNEYINYVKYDNTMLNGYYMVEYVDDCFNTVVVPIVVNNQMLSNMEEYKPVRYKKIHKTVIGV